MSLSTVRCSRCSALAAVAIQAEAPVRGELGAKHCPTCGEAGTLRLLARLPIADWREPHRIGVHEEPADELDEADDVERRRAWRAERTT